MRRPDTLLQIKSDHILFFSKINRIIYSLKLSRPYVLFVFEDIFLVR